MKSLFVGPQDPLSKVVVWMRAVRRLGANIIVGDFAAAAGYLVVELGLTPRTAWLRIARGIPPVGDLVLARLCVLALVHNEKEKENRNGSGNGATLGSPERERERSSGNGDHHLPRSIDESASTHPEVNVHVPAKAPLSAHLPFMGPDPAALQRDESTHDALLSTFNSALSPNRTFDSIDAFACQPSSHPLQFVANILRMQRKVMR
ncbi:hypothetical protein BGY98DRAFT_1099326 [Russula aff. rugulosa BPL654]|nr:hypothetical protein BGY98DRAFT_1099326 [Russula aff. rugulosa BPL654]